MSYLVQSPVLPLCTCVFSVLSLYLSVFWIIWLSAYRLIRWLLCNLTCTPCLSALQGLADIAEASQHGLCLSALQCSVYYTEALLHNLCLSVSVVIMARLHLYICFWTQFTIIPCLIITPVSCLSCFTVHFLFVRYIKPVQSLSPLLSIVSSYYVPSVHCHCLVSCSMFKFCLLLDLLLLDWPFFLFCPDFINKLLHLDSSTSLARYRILSLNQNPAEVCLFLLSP